MNTTTEKRLMRVLTLHNSRIIFIGLTRRGLRFCLQEGQQRYSIQYGWAQLFLRLRAAEWMFPEEE